MSRAHGQVRRSQVITTWGPGALIDLPRHAGIVGGLETWPSIGELEEIVEPRLTRKLALMTGARRPAAVRAAAGCDRARRARAGHRRLAVPAVVRRAGGAPSGPGQVRGRGASCSASALDERGKFDGRDVVPTRFVRACPRGHIDDIDWRRFVHGGDDRLHAPAWLDERGTGGDLADLIGALRVRQVARRSHEAAEFETDAARHVPRAAPVARRGKRARTASLPSRLLIRTAANAYFPQVLSALSLPDSRTGRAARLVAAALGRPRASSTTQATWRSCKKKPQVAGKLAGFDDDDVLDGDRGRESAAARPSDRSSRSSSTRCSPRPRGSATTSRSIRTSTPGGCPTPSWRRTPLSDGIARVVQLHRLREVLALIGFTRFEAVTPDIDGEYETRRRARPTSRDEPTWFPAVENRGEGIFLAARHRRRERVARSTRGASARRPARRRVTSGGPSDRNRAAAVPGRPVRAAAHALAPAACSRSRCAAAIRPARSASASTSTPPASGTG